MRKNLSDWASIAEIVSGIGVLITLVVLIFSVRANTAIIQATAYENVVGELNEISHLYLQDAELLRIWQMHSEGRADELSADDDFKLVILLRTIWRSYESAYRWYLNGVLGPSEWTRFDRNNCGLRAAMSSAHWEMVRSVLSDEFSMYIDSECTLAPVERL